MSSTSKGTAHEVRAKEILEAEGYLVHKTVHSSLFKTQYGWRRTAANDLLGCFDLLAIHPHRPPQLIQVTEDTKSSGSSGNRKVKIDELVPFAPAMIGVQLWAWHGERRDQFFRVYVRDECVCWRKVYDITRKGIKEKYP
jgi:hypothetical protein